MKKEIRSILIVKTSAIGDVIQTFPVLEYLRKRFPKARIDWAVEKESVALLQAHPLLSNVIPIDSKAWRKTLFKPQTWEEFAQFKESLQSVHYDLLFDLQANVKSAMVTGCAKAEEKVGFGWRDSKEKANLLVTTKRISTPLGIPVRSKYMKLVQLYFNDHEEFVSEGIQLKLTCEEEAQLQDMFLPQELCLMVCFGSKWVNKQLTTPDWISFLKKVEHAYRPFFFLVFGNQKEKRIAEELHTHFPHSSRCVGAMSLPLWQALMRQMRGVISVDSAALHLCATTLTPSFGLFGPSLAHVYKPLEERHAAFQGGCPYNKNFSERCPLLRTCKTGACLHDLDENVVFHQFQGWAERTMLEIC